jgi:glycosyltransferase involved in cell wall biosynthesis
MERKRLVTLFPFSQNVHLAKDVGMIPFILHKVNGYESTIACYEIGEYPYLDVELKGLNIIFIKKIFNNELLDGLWFILTKHKQYDILMCFHLLRMSLMWLSLFKILKGNRGRTYLKMDADFRIYDFDLKKYRFRTLFMKMIKSVNLISVESKQLCEFINSEWNIDVKLIPNGFFDDFKREDTTWEEKENVIITVGTIGLPRKSNETLMLAFEQFYRKNKEWKLKLIGPIVEPSFNQFVESYFKRTPELVNVVEFTGNIVDKKQLLEIYKKSKIFALTSKIEGFPLVYLEAVKTGCYIITSNVTSALDITDNETLGDVFSVGNVDELAIKLHETAINQSKLKDNVKKIQDFGYQHFYWPTICSEIDSYLYS